jgi:hypothetical protein
MSQTDRRFRLVVSDNSSTNELLDLISPCEDLLYIKRPKVLSSIDHGNVCLSEIRTEYFTFFHDDDLMLPNYVADFWKAKSLFPAAVAFGANALVERHGKFTGLSFKSMRPYIGPITPDNLLRRYFSHNQSGIAPLPSYIYKKEALQSLRFDVSGGKYSDVQWLSSWAARGLMIWIANPMMIYRLHDSNDSRFESRYDRLRFLAYLKSSSNRFSPEILEDYRFFLYKKLLPSLKTNEHGKVHRLLFKFIFAHRYQRLCRLSFYQALINKALIKLFMSLNKKV